MAWYVDASQHACTILPTREIWRGTWNVERGTWNVERGTWNVERGTWNTRETISVVVQMHHQVICLSNAEYFQYCVIDIKFMIQALQL